MKTIRVYLGYTGKCHRTVTFKHSDIFKLQLTVEEVENLTDDMVFVNCTVINGKAVPNIEGVKVLSACSRRESSKYYVDKEIDTRELWAFNDKEPTYMYGCDSHKFRPDKIFKAYGKSEELVAYTDWDGVADESTLFLLGPVVVGIIGDGYKVNNILFMTYEGYLFFDYNIQTYTSLGFKVVQVDKPKLYSVESPVVVESGKLALRADIIHGIERDKTCVEFAYLQDGGRKPYVLDLRAWTSVRVFGIRKVSATSMVIMPEGVEQVWLGAFRGRTTLKAIYIPGSVAKLHKTGFKPHYFKNTVIYSSSAAVELFCKENGFTHKFCSCADDMLSDYDKCSSPEYIGVGEASLLYNLIGMDSSNGGSILDSTLSAIKFSCLDTGMATEKLHETYPVVQTCDYDVPTEYTLGNISVLGDETRCRILAAAFTQFYPLKKSRVSEDCVETLKYALVGYNVYIKMLEGKYYDDANSHIVLLEDIDKGRVIHQFMCDSTIYHILSNLWGASTAGRDPSGVFRYADKLPPIERLNDYYGRLTDKVKIVQAMLSTLLVFAYSKRPNKLIGIDLHTADIVSMSYILYPRTDWYTPCVECVTEFARVKAVSNITVYTKENVPSTLFAKSCVYNKSRLRS